MAGPSGPARSSDRWPPVTYWMKATAGVLAVLALAALLIRITNIVVLVLVSLILALGFQPAVRFLERRRFRRGLAVATILLGGAAVIGVFLWLVLPDVIRSIGELVSQGPALIRDAQDRSGLVAQLNDRFDLEAKLRDASADIPGTALGLVSSFTAFVFNGLTILILTIYFTVALPRMREWVARLLQGDDRREFVEILDESTQRVGAYVLGMFVVSATAGVATFIALAIIGVPFAAALAFFVALADLIPTVGALIGAAVAVAVAASQGAGAAVATGIFFLAYQQVENYLIHPRVMKRAIDMPAAAVILAVLIGGSLLGVIGALLAIPMAAIIKVAFRELYLEDRRARVATSERIPSA